MKSIVDFETLFFTFGIFLFCTTVLALVSGNNFSVESSLSYTFSNENRSPLTFNMLGVLGLLSAAIINGLTQLPPNLESKLVRLFCVFPINSSLTLGAAASATFIVWGFGYLFSGNYNSGWVYILTGLLVLLLLACITWFANFFTSQKLSKLNRAIWGGGFTGLVVVVVLVDISKYAAS